MKKEISGINLLSLLASAFSPSGNERPVLDIIKEQTESCCDGSHFDRAGNLICEIRSKKKAKKKVMFSSSADEAGFMIKDIDDEGHLKIALLGGINTAVLSGRKVRVGVGNKTVCGIVASKPIHSLSRDERTKPTPADKLYIELGTGSREETEKLVKIGDFGTFESKAESFGDGYYRSKALDYRVGCAVMCELMRAVDREKLENDLYFAFTVLGAAGLKESGAVVAANVICPDEAFVFGTLGSSDMYGAKERDIVCTPGDGVIVSTADSRAIYNVELTNFLTEKLKAAGIKLQPNRTNSGGGISAEIQRSGNGVKVTSLYIPVKYPRTGSCVINKKDYENILAAAKLCL